MHLGFTGRSAGITPEQVQSLEGYLRGFNPSEWTCPHNDGEGSDQVFSGLAKACGFLVETTPGDLRPMPRNRHLVAEADILVAAPPTDFIIKNGSGTWETVKYMWKAEKPVHILLSTGEIIYRKEDVQVLSTKR